jgi:hypothetical protein
MRLCKCGCGEPRAYNSQYKAGHSVQATRGGKFRRINTIKPAGMSYARALEIAVAAQHG